MHSRTTKQKHHHHHNNNNNNNSHSNRHQDSEDEVVAMEFEQRSQAEPQVNAAVPLKRRRSGEWTLDTFSLHPFSIESSEVSNISVGTRTISALSPPPKQQKQQLQGPASAHDKHDGDDDSHDSAAPLLFQHDPPHTRLSPPSLSFRARSPSGFSGSSSSSSSSSSRSCRRVTFQCLKFLSLNLLAICFSVLFWNGSWDLVTNYLLPSYASSNLYYEIACLCLGLAVLLWTDTFSFHTGRGIGTSTSAIVEGGGGEAQLDRSVVSTTEEWHDEGSGEEQEDDDDDVNHDLAAETLCRTSPHSSHPAALSALASFSVLSPLPLSSITRRGSTVTTITAATTIAAPPLDPIIPSTTTTFGAPSRRLNIGRLGRAAVTARFRHQMTADIAQYNHDWQLRRDAALQAQAHSLTSVLEDPQHSLNVTTVSNDSMVKSRTRWWRFCCCCRRSDSDGGVNLAIEAVPMMEYPDLPSFRSWSEWCAVRCPGVYKLCLILQTIIAMIAVVVLWKGTWNLLDVYLVAPSVPRELVYVGVGFIILVLTDSLQSQTGVDISSSDAGSASSDSLPSTIPSRGPVSAPIRSSPRRRPP